MLRNLAMAVALVILLGSSAFSQCEGGTATPKDVSCCDVRIEHSMVCMGSTGMCNPFGSMISCTQTCSIAVASDDICGLPSTAPKIKLQQAFDFQPLISSAADL